MPAKTNEEAEQECETCGGEGVVEGALVCGNVRAGGCRDGMCGGCYPEKPCPDCVNAEANEPDWDAMRESREETMDEVGWESPE